MKKIHALSLGAFIAGFLGVEMYARALEEKVSGGAMQELLVVTKDMKAGALVGSENLGVVRVPSDYVDARRIPAKEKAHLIGAEIGQALRAGDGLVWSDLSDGAAHKHLAALIAPGRRAYSLDRDASSLGGLLRVGDQVDVLVETDGETELLLEQILVLAVGGRMDSVDEGSLSRPARSEGVTISVGSDQAELLLGAEARGKLRLVLRNPDDRQRRQQPPVDAASQAKKQAAPRPDTEKREIEHVR